MQFRLSGANLPNIVPLTVMVKHYPVQQTGFYTTFFHGQGNGAFSGANYFGCHPYPQGGSGGTVHNWEISMEGRDDIIDENANSTVVTKNQWYTQATISRASGADTTVDFYWDLATSRSRRISHTQVGGVVNNAISPVLVFGDAPWAENTERLSGRLRGIQIYNAQLSEAHIAALSALDTDASVLAYLSTNSITSLWYLNMNPTPTDIADKSGNGRDPAWVNANRPTLWNG